MSEQTGYPDPPSWGNAFTYLAALAAQGGKPSRLANAALRHLRLQNESQKNYPWEFIIYALHQSARLPDAPRVIPANEYRSKGTRMFNWYLLRNVNRNLTGRSSAADHLKLRAALAMYQDPSGIILDEFRTRSLQYHAFCLFILADLVELLPGLDWLRNRFTRGVEFAVRHVLSDGSALWIGRGQDQIFGYGSLIYALEYHHQKVTPLPEVLLDRVASHVLGFQRPDGSFPLVLRCREPEAPATDYRQDRPPGWYGYNTLYDYQPFLAYSLFKAHQIQ